MQYYQEKFNTNHQLKSISDLTLEITSESIIYKGDFFMEFKKDTIPYGVTFVHELDVNKNTGDFTIRYNIINKKNIGGTFKNNTVIKKNNFDMLSNLAEMGFYRGEKRRNFWGVKYNKALFGIFNAIKDDIQKEFVGTYLENKDYWGSSNENALYNIIVDYHLYKKNIKGHNNVYKSIMNVYPKKLWLKRNDNKFLPAVLDEHGIKSKYFIKELSNVEECGKPSVNIRSLIYLCTLFGQNYIDYIRKIDWKTISAGYFVKTKKHICRNENEKRALIRAFNSHPKDAPRTNDVLDSIYSLFEVRSFLEENGHTNLKINFKCIEDVKAQLEVWLMMKKHLTLGYMLLYKMPEYFIRDIEIPIEYNNKTYRPKILLSDNDFCIEGMIMKNCMGKQFIHGSIHIFMAISTGKKRINIRYQNGIPIMSYGKANSPVPEDTFKEVMNILNNKMLKYKDLTWTREKRHISQK